MMERGMLGLLPVLPSSTKRRSNPGMGRSGGGECYKKDFESSTMLRSRETVETRMEHFDVCLLEYSSHDRVVGVRDKNMNPSLPLLCPPFPSLQYPQTGGLEF
jgi:hypothetical protein